MTLATEFSCLRRGHHRAVKADVIGVCQIGVDRYESQLFGIPLPNKSGPRQGTSRELNMRMRLSVTAFALPLIALFLVGLVVAQWMMSSGTASPPVATAASEHAAGPLVNATSIGTPPKRRLVDQVRREIRLRRYPLGPKKLPHRPRWQSIRSFQAHVP